MFSFTVAANDTFSRADPVANLHRGLYVFGRIGPSVLLNGYNVYFIYPLRCSKTHAFIASVELELLTKRRVGLYILPGSNIWGIDFAWPGCAIALKLNAVDAKI